MAKKNKNPEVLTPRLPPGMPPSPCLCSTLLQSGVLFLISMGILTLSLCLPLLPKSFIHKYMQAPLSPFTPASLLPW